MKKSINQIFKNNVDLKNQVEVKELIEYCRYLEDELSEFSLKKTRSLESRMESVLKDIYSSINATIAHNAEVERFGETDPIDIDQALNGLRDYLRDFSRTSGFVF